MPRLSYYCHSSYPTPSKARQSICKSKFERIKNHSIAWSLPDHPMLEGCDPPPPNFQDRLHSTYHFCNHISYSKMHYNITNLCLWSFMPQYNENRSKWNDSNRQFQIILHMDGLLIQSPIQKSKPPIVMHSKRKSDHFTLINGS